jgi:hypothetical protein
MVLELTRFLAGAIVFLVPGILFSAARRLGRDWLENFIHGSCLGLAAAVYLAMIVSEFDLRWFYPVWAAVGLLSVFVFFKSDRKFAPSDEPSIRRWMILLLLIVGASRYAIALPQELPNGWDPSFHSILARQIQLTHHAINDWMPFVPVRLNYPTGSHTLLAIMSNLTGLPVHTIFKDFLTFLGVLTTGQIFLLTRRVIGDSSAGLWGAFAYGMWADYGSINYSGWGGLPNEMAMLFLLAMLVTWLESASILIMAILLAALVLTHHHVMLTAAAILAVAIVRPGQSARRSLILAGLAATVLDAFFLIPYASHISTLGSTHVLHSGELPLPVLHVIENIGYAFLLFSVLGIILAFWRRRKAPIDPIAMIGVATLIVLYILCEYGWPLIHGSTILTPTRFPTDMAAFLAVFAGLAVSVLQRHFRLPGMILFVLMLLASLVELDTWRALDAGPGESPDFLAACAWVKANSSPNVLVVSGEEINAMDNQKSWIPYLTWRRAVYVPLPDSEPLDEEPKTLTTDGGIVGILGPDDPKGYPVLWRGESGIRVVRLR